LEGAATLLNWFRLFKFIFNKYWCLQCDVGSRFVGEECRWERTSGATLHQNKSLPRFVVLLKMTHAIVQ